MKTICSLFLLAAYCLAQTNAPNRAAYKIDLKIRDSDDQRAQATRTYSFVLDDNARGQLRAGKKVPFGDKGWADVGVNIDARVLERAGDNLLVADIDLEISSLEGSGINQIRWHGQSRVAPGKPTVISSLQDPVLQKRLDIEITVTRLP